MQINQSESHRHTHTYIHTLPHTNRSTETQSHSHTHTHTHPPCAHGRSSRVGTHVQMSYSAKHFVCRSVSFCVSVCNRQTFHLWEFLRTFLCSSAETQRLGRLACKPVALYVCAGVWLSLCVSTATQELRDWWRWFLPAGHVMDEVLPVYSEVSDLILFESFLSVHKWVFIASFFPFRYPTFGNIEVSLWIKTERSFYEWR